ncbi:MAG: ATP-binding protein, partial [Actinomycetota bacterium]
MREQALGAQIVGREPELGALRDFVGADASARACVLTGGPGIGKTTLWEAGVAAARGSGTRVLVARPSDAEARLAFAALTDLFDTVDIEALTAVPEPQRGALQIALLRA